VRHLAGLKANGWDDAASIDEPGKQPWQVGGFPPSAATNLPSEKSAEKLSHSEALETHRETSRITMEKEEGKK
jgi:hypothetical protein